MEPTVKKESAEKIPFLERSIVRTILPIAGFVIICVLFAILTDGKLFKPKNISLLLSQSYMLLISSIGVFMVMTMGGLDFSQGSMLGVCSIVVCYLSHYNIILAVIGGVVTGGLIGLMNGYFNVKRKITSFIVTICSMYLFRGVCAYATTNSPVYGVSDISKYNTLPFMLTFTIIIFVAAYLIFTFTGLGSRLKAIGAGETAARFAGIRVERTKMLIYMTAGCITGLAAGDADHDRACAWRNAGQRRSKGAFLQHYSWCYDVQGTVQWSCHADDPDAAAAADPRYYLPRRSGIVQ